MTCPVPALRAVAEEQGEGWGCGSSSPIPLMGFGAIVTVTRTWPGCRKG